jgi:hypothetical protein
LLFGSGVGFDEALTMVVSIGPRGMLEVGKIYPSIVEFRLDGDVFALFFILRAENL